MEKILAIDPGTLNLGWAYTENGQVHEAGVDKVWVKTSPIHMTLVPAVVRWYRERREYFSKSDLVLIELQYMNKGSYGVFAPMIVMEVIISCCELEFPGKIKTVQSSAIKQHFKISGSYEERKKEVVRVAGLDHLDGRVHDIADCLLMVDYERNKRRTTDHLLQLAWEKDKARTRLKLKINNRDASPVHERTHRKCLTCSTSAHRTYVKRGTGYICGDCYGKEWRKERKRLSKRL